MITVNGQRITVPDGASVMIVNGEVFVNGACVKNNIENTTIIIEGNAGSVKTDKASVTVKGNVLGSVDAGGSVTCGDVYKGVDAGGSVTCSDVDGDIDAGGSVKCGKVSGSIDAGGSVRHG